MNWHSYKQNKLKTLEELKEQVDVKVFPLLNIINSNPNLMTTSSCYGRIVLLESDIEETKKTSSFYRKWHRILGVSELKKAIEKYNGKLVLWFRVEPLILHVAAKDLETAKEFLKKVRAAGLKRGGIQIINEKILMEIRGHETIVIPLNAVELNHEKIVLIANQMFERNERKVKKIISLFTS